MKVSLAILAVLVVVALILGANTANRITGTFTDRSGPEALKAFLAPYTRHILPEGEGPFPTVLLFSGCDGVRDNMDRWATAFRAEGWASVIVDSHTPRGLQDFQSWRLVCAAQALSGPERAGDVAVTLAAALDWPETDPTRIALFGASHGGWSILEMLALQSSGEPPHNLTDWPDGLEGFDVDALKVLLLYPYCGPPSIVSRNGWTAEAPVQFQLAENDSIVSTPQCLGLAVRMKADGRPVTTLVHAGVDHGFDQKERSQISPLEFAPETTEAAIDAGIRFLGWSAQE